MSDIQFAIPGLMEMQSPISDMLPLYFALESHSAANSLWRGIPTVGPITLGDAGPLPTATVAVLRFYRESPFYDREPALELTSPTAVVIGDATDAWVFDIPPQPLPLAVGKWLFDLSVGYNVSDTVIVMRGHILITP